MISITELNAFSHEQAHDWFMQTCTASRWCDLMAAARPFSSISAIEKVACDYWRSMGPSDFLEAFKGHPMIGDVNSLREKYRRTKGLASTEQAGAMLADEATLIALQQANYDYVNKHGFIFIICATGLSAETMLDALLQRINNSTSTEMETAAKEQMKITLLRIHKALNLQDSSNE